MVNMGMQANSKYIHTLGYIYGFMKKAIVEFSQEDIIIINTWSLKYLKDIC